MLSSGPRSGTIDPRWRRSTARRIKSASRWACDILPRPGDTQGVQQAGRWEQHGRISVRPDARYTLVRLEVDTNVVERHDVVLARFDFNPSEAEGRSEEHTSEL